MYDYLVFMGNEYENGKNILIFAQKRDILEKNYPWWFEASILMQNRLVLVNEKSLNNKGAILVDHKTKKNIKLPLVSYHSTT